MSTNKGSYENPYTYDEYELLLLNDEWEGGFVRFPDGIKYSTGTADVYGSSGNDGSGSDSGSNTWDPNDWGSGNWGSEFFGSDTMGSYDPWAPDGNTGNQGGNGGMAGGGNTGGGTPSGGGSGSSHSDDKDDYPDYPDVLSTDKFSKFKPSEPRECFKRCKEMLTAGHGNWSGGDGKEILMANSSKTGEATTAASSFNEGLDYIDSQLAQGKPVIVTVDYQPGSTTGSTRDDQAGDHFVIIVGGGRTSGYHYFDPATEDVGRGTSTDNKFTMQGNLLKDVNNCRGEGKEYEKNYTLTCVRY